MAYIVTTDQVRDWQEGCNVHDNFLRKRLNCCHYFGLSLSEEWVDMMISRNLYFPLVSLSSACCFLIYFCMLYPPHFYVKEKECCSTQNNIYYTRGWAAGKRLDHSNYIELTGRKGGGEVIEVSLCVSALYWFLFSLGEGLKRVERAVCVLRCQPLTRFWPTFEFSAVRFCGRFCLARKTEIH